MTKGYIIIEYGSTQYVGMAQKKMAAPLNMYKSDVQNSALDVVRSFYEPYQSFSNVFINNKTASAARDHRWSTTSASR